MRARISYDDNRGRTQTTQVRPGQRLVIGSSFSADIALGDTLGVVSEHAVLQLRANEFSVRNLTGNEDTVLVNGQPTSKAVLADGDAIEIGSNRLAVLLDDPNSNSKGLSAGKASSAKSLPVNESSVTQDSSDNVDEDLSSETVEILPNKTLIISMPFDRLSKVIDGKVDSDISHCCWHFACNHKRSNIKQEKPELTDYLKDSPEEISGENSLCLLKINDSKHLNELWTSYVGNDAGLVGVAKREEDGQSIEEQFPFLAAWFMIPSTLKFHLTNGSPLLLEKVFGLFQFLVLSEDGGTNAQIITNDLNIDSLDAFVKHIEGVAE